MKKTVIFDLGGVLIDWDPRYMYSSIFETKDAMEHFLATVCTSDWNEEQDGGRSIEEANKVLIEQFPEYTQEILAFYGRWEEMLNGVFEDTVDILRKICNQYPKVFALTNWSAETFPVALKRYEFLNWFEGVLVSGREKLKKPDPEIYKLLLSRYDLEADDCLFIDDNLRNVKAAIKTGIASIHYKNSAQLIEDLKQYDIII